MDLLSYLLTAVKIFVVLNLVLLLVAYTTLAERRIAGFIQDRLGPNRVGPQGLLQPIADGLKSFVKEEVIPGRVNKVLFVLAPAIITVPAFMNIAVIPFGTTIPIFGHEVRLQIADINAGILYIFAMASLGVYGLVLAGWASNNKYSLLGGLRASAQLISYELSMGLSVIGVLMVAGTLSLNEIVSMQSGMWNIIRQPLGFLIFVAAAFAETNRLPFDLPEAEPELVAGYHTEYSSMKFALFYLAEYVNMLISSCLLVSLYLGGWYFPFLSSLDLSPFAMGVMNLLIFSAKVSAMIFIYIWVRWTLPRFRYDQLMALGWKVFLPLAFLNVFITGLVLVMK